MGLDLDHTGELDCFTNLTAGLLAKRAKDEDGKEERGEEWERALWLLTLLILTTDRVWFTIHLFSAMFVDILYFANKFCAVYS